MYRRSLRHALTVCAMLTLAAVPAFAQTQTFDEGAFRILVGGREVGRETFSIRQSGSGADAVVVAQGRVSYDAQQLDASLELTGSAFRPAVYELQLRGPEERRITGRLLGGRFSAKILSPAGESMREYLASDGAVVADEGVAHQYYFLARRVTEGAASIPLLVPRQNRQVTVQVRVAGTEAVDVAGTSIQARRLVIEGGETKTVWVDDEGRVLRLEIPARDYTAIRVAPPG